MTLFQVTVELKNDLAIQGTLHSVDQYLNIKLHNTRVVNEQKYPHMVSVQARQWCAAPFTQQTVDWCHCNADVSQKLLHQRVCGQICAGNTDAFDACNIHIFRAFDKPALLIWLPGSNVSLQKTEFCVGTPVKSEVQGQVSD